MEQLQREVDYYHSFIERLLQEMGKVIVGQRPLLEKVLVGLLSRGHILLEGVPGLAKTLTVQTLASGLALQFQRIQFTPDLLPADLIGTMIYNPKEGQFSAKFGPVFANVILADEINRAPAKVQSALLEAMQEQQVTIGENTYRLPDPFLVLATQNPVEQEGTYTLPEAQVDRFMIKLLLTYPKRQEELEIMDRMIERPKSTVEPVFPKEQLVGAQGLVRKIFVAPEIKEYLLDIIFSTREPERFGLMYQGGQKRRPLGDYIEQGVSPRATLALNLAARAYAMIQKRSFVTPDDVKAVALDVLRHRITLSYEAEADLLTSDQVLQEILNHLEVP